MAEAGQRDFGRLDGSAGLLSLFEDGDLPAFGCEMDRGREPIMAGPYDDRVISHRFVVPSPLKREYFHLHRICPCVCPASTGTMLMKCSPA